MDHAAHSLTNRLTRRAARAFAALPDAVMRRLAGTPIVIEGQMLDPQIQAMLRLFGPNPGQVAPLDELRAGFDAEGDWLTRPVGRAVQGRALRLGGVPCEIHARAGLADVAPALIFYHGGGHAAGSLVSHRPVARMLAEDLPVRVILVGHRLAPEHPFPAGIHDCLAVFDAVQRDAAALGVDPGRIGLCGDSAGANAAAVVAQQRRAAPQPPRFQMLWSPWLDLSRQSRSYDLFATGFFLEKPTMEWYTQQYLSRPQDALDPRASPLLGDVAAVCPAAVMVAGFDPLRDEGRAYADRLRAAGVPTQFHEIEGMVHIWLNLSGSVRRARAAYERAVEILRAAL